jgi:hypothetical protein
MLERLGMVQDLPWRGKRREGIAKSGFKLYHYLDFSSAAVFALNYVVLQFSPRASDFTRIIRNGSLNFKSR